jgi:ComF family protein
VPGSTFGQWLLGRVQGISEPLGSGTGAEWFGLGVGRGPSGEADGFEGGGDFSVRAVGGGIDVLRAVQDGAADGVTDAPCHGVGFTHGAEVVHEVGKIAIHDGAGVGIGYGQGKTGALNKCAKGTDFAHGQDAGREAARDLGLGCRKRGAKFVQRLAAEGECEEEAVGAQGPAALDKLADGIMRPMQAKGVDDEVVGVFLQGEGDIVGNDVGVGHCLTPDFRETGDNGWRRKRSVNLDQSFLNLCNGIGLQKRVGGTGTVARQGLAVGKRGGRLHGGQDVEIGMTMQGLLHLFYPPQCLTCDARVTTDFGLCGECWRVTPFASGLVCDQCGVPLPGQDSSEVAVCDDCISIARPWARGRAALVYKDNARHLVLALKHGDRLDLVRPAAQWMWRAAEPVLKTGMLVVPIPLHWMRLFRRRYNQAALLSESIARLAGLDHCPDVLQRRRRTGTQDGHSRDGRFANVVGSLVVHPKRSAMVEGRHVLLVDDVMTSGATFAAGAEACLAAGASDVSVLCLARVAKDA